MLLSILLVDNLALQNVLYVLHVDYNLNKR
jgi:hypothetical protein